MQARFVLGSDDAFKRAKDAFVWLWDHRADEDLHEIEIKEWKKNRSTRANSFYWAAVVTEGSNQLGYAPEELHCLLCCALYGTRKIKVGSIEIEIPNRTTTTPNKMTVEEFNLHIERACALLAEQGITIDQSGWTR